MLAQDMNARLLECKKKAGRELHTSKHRSTPEPLVRLFVAAGLTAWNATVVSSPVNVQTLLKPYLRG